MKMAYFSAFSPLSLKEVFTSGGEKAFGGVSSDGIGPRPGNSDCVCLKPGGMSGRGLEEKVGVTEGG